MGERSPLGLPMSGNRRAIPDAVGRFSDAAHRISDAVTQAIADGKSGHWMFFSLEDGRHNGRTYPQRRGAVQDAGSNADRVMYLKIPLDSCPPAEAASFLEYNRWAIQQMGGRLPDPHKDQIVKPKRLELLPDHVQRAGRLILPRGVQL